MSTIIAGHFEDMDHAQKAVEALSERGFQSGEYACYPDSPASLWRRLFQDGEAIGAELIRAAAGTAVGGAIGGATGLAVGSLGGPLGAAAGAAVGAYVGSLTGSMAQSLEENRPPDEEKSSDAPPVGPMVAVCADRPGSEAAAIAALAAHGTTEIRRAQGLWRDGGWADYDPAAPAETLLDTSSPEGGQAAGYKEH